MAKQRPNWLVTFIGKGGYSVVDYRLPNSNQSVTTRFAPIAISKWMKQTTGLSKLIVFTTDGVLSSFKDYSNDYSKNPINNYDAFLEDLNRFGLAKITLERHLIPENVGQQGVAELFKNVRDVFSDTHPNTTVYVDVTHGFRFIPILTLSVLKLLASRKKLSFGRILYGQYEGIPQIVDITVFLTLSDMAESITLYQEYGVIESLGQDLSKLSEQVNSKEGKRLKMVGSLIKKMADPYHLGSVIQTERLLAEIHQESQAMDTSNDPDLAASIQPLKKELEELFDLAAKFYGITDDLLLNEAELERELMLIEQWIKTGLPERGLAAMREWLVNRVLWMSFGKQALTPDIWLERIYREAAEVFLGNWVYRGARGQTLLPQKNEVQNLYSKIGDYRNNLAHGGFNKKYNEELKQNTIKNNSAKYLKEIRQYHSDPNKDDIWIFPKDWLGKIKGGKDG